MMDDLRFLFSFFFSSLFFLSLCGVVVGLARDGCLVRSWLFGHAVGLRAAGLAAVVWKDEFAQQIHPHHTTPGGMCGFSLTPR